MTYETDLAIEIRVSFTEQVIDPIGFLENDCADSFSICALVEQNVQSWVTM